MSEDSFIEITGLYFELRPKSRRKDCASVIESIWSSMSSSMQLARDCLEQEGGLSVGAAPNAPMEGLERFAQVIDNVLNRIKVRLNDTEIRLDYFTHDSKSGVSLVARVKRLDYKNEAGGDPPDKPPSAPDEGDADGPAAYSVPVYSTHQITMENVTFYMEEFRISSGRRVAVPPPNMESMLIASEQFYSTISELPDSAQSHAARQRTPDETSSCSEDDDEREHAEDCRTRPIQIACFHGTMDLRITMKQTVSVQGPKVQLELQLGAVNIFLTPRQLHALIYLCGLFLEEKDKPAPHKSHRMHESDTETERTPPSKPYNAMSGNLGLNQGWSSDPMSDVPSQMSVKSLEVDTIKESNSMSNSMTSFASGYTQTTIRNRRRGVIEVDPNADILRLNIRVACCAIVLLQEDVLVESASDADCPLNEDSTTKLEQLAGKFFETVDHVSVNSGAKDLNQTVELLSEGCRKNQLR